MEGSMCSPKSQGSVRFEKWWYQTEERTLQPAGPQPFIMAVHNPNSVLTQPNF